MKKAAIYNPYWDTLGGGERYSASVGRVLASLGYLVDIQWKDKNILKKIEKQFGIKTSNFNVVDDIQRGEGYEICFWVSDGSIPLLRARNNLLHFQVPFKGVRGRTLLNKMKFFRIKKILCNSYFTKRVIDQEYGVDSLVVYPPCDTSGIKPKKKENIILSVGRFSQLLQAKRQDVLVDVFKNLCKKGLSGWKLILAGGIEVGEKNYLRKLKKKAFGFPIKFIINPTYSKLKDLYGTSKIFWSASGFGVDERKNPQKVEHFGITIVEAMAGGNVPLVFSAGGHKEIVQDKLNGFLWQNKRELIKLTEILIEDEKYLRKLAKEVVEVGKKFSYEKFKNQIESIL